MIQNNYKKLFVIILIALLFSILAFYIADELTLIKLDIPIGPCTQSEYLTSLEGTNTTCEKIPFSGSTTLFLHNTSSDVVGSLVFNVSIFPDTPAQYVNISSPSNGNVSIGNWTSPALDVLFVPGGTYSLHAHVRKEGGVENKVVKIFYETYIMNSTGGNATLIGTSEYGVAVDTDPDFDDDIEATIPSLNLNLTDRMHIKVFYSISGVGVSPTLLTFRFDDLTDARLSFPSITLDTTIFPTITEMNTAIQTESNTKVNKSGDTMTGKLLIDTAQTPGLDLNYSFESKHNGITRTYLYRNFGIQEWFLNDSVADRGWITYSTPGGLPGFVFYNSTRQNRTDISLTPYGIGMGLSAAAVYPLNINRINGSIQSKSLQGSGDAYACIDSSGKLYRSATTCV